MKSHFLFFECDKLLNVLSKGTKVNEPFAAQKKSSYGLRYWKNAKIQISLVCGFTVFAILKAEDFSFNYFVIRLKWRTVCND